MKKVYLPILLTCAVGLFGAKKEATMLRDGNMTIPLIHFSADASTGTKTATELYNEFYKKEIYPLEQYRILAIFSPDTHNLERRIRKTIYRLVHPGAGDLLPEEEVYPKTLAYLYQENFASTLTPEGSDVYLSVLCKYASYLKEQIFYAYQYRYAIENIPQNDRLAMWRILAKHVTFTPAFTTQQDAQKIEEVFENTLFSILCEDRDEAKLLSHITTANPIKIYRETVLLKRPTALENLTTVLYTLGADIPPQWTPEKAFVAAKLAQLKEDATPEPPQKKITPEKSEESLLPKLTDEEIKTELTPQEVKIEEKKETAIAEKPKKEEGPEFVAPKQETEIKDIPTSPEPSSKKTWSIKDIFWKKPREEKIPTLAEFFAKEKEAERKKSKKAGEEIFQVPQETEISLEPEPITEKKYEPEQPIKAVTEEGQAAEELTGMFV